VVFDTPVRHHRLSWAHGTGFARRAVADRKHEINLRRIGGHELVQNAVIFDVEASRTIREAEVGAARTMVDWTAQRSGLKPQQLAADSAYGSAANLAGLVEAVLDFSGG